MRLNNSLLSLLSGIYRLTSSLTGNAKTSSANKTNGLAMPTRKAVILTPIKETQCL